MLSGSNWHIGSQIMMTFALIVLFLLEFAVIGYACIKRLERHKSKVVGIVIALSVTAGGLYFLLHVSSLQLVREGDGYVIGFSFYHYY